jgi:addiction module RelE/StbE family toxin
VAKIKYSEIAIRDLERIFDYIAEDLKNPTAAFNTVNHIQNTIDKLSDFPHIGTSLSAHYKNVEGFRFLVCGNYLAFYRDQAGEVYIDRILYGKRDYIRILFGELPEGGIE